jgi:hypothetical protein
MIEHNDSEQGGPWLASKMIVALCWGAVGVYLATLQVSDAFRRLFQHLKRFKRTKRK